MMRPCYLCGQWARDDASIPFGREYPRRYHPIIPAYAHGRCRAEISADLAANEEKRIERERAEAQ